MMEMDERITISTTIPFSITYNKSEGYENWEEMKKDIEVNHFEYLLDNLDKDDLVKGIMENKEKITVEVEEVEGE